MSQLDDKINQHFAGLVVRKDLVKTVKGNAIVPTYLLEYPPRQNSCRPDRIDEQGAMMEERIGSIRTGIQG